MTREDMVVEISMRRDIPMDEVEEVLEEEDFIYLEEKLCRKHKKGMIVVTVISMMIITGAVVVYILDKKQKINMEAIIKKYTDKLSKMKEA